MSNWIAPPPTPARLVKKLEKEEQKFSFYLFILNSIIIIILSFGKIWVAGKAEPIPPRVAVSL